MAKTKVLIIDDDQSMLELAEFHLQAQGYETVRAETGEEGLKLVEGIRFDVILTDLQLPDIGGIEVVKRLKEISPHSEIIMISGHGSVAKAVDATKAGAFYFVEKPVEFEELMILIEKAVERGQQAEEIRQLRGRLTNRDSYYNIIGSSKAMQNIYEMIDSVAESDANILIIGESGTGKELIANAIHYKSLRAKKPFVKINCSALPKELIESELFGHTKGAFTGAAMDKVGLISRADDGSLLLDEIGEMPVDLQPKLLRVLQERVFYRLGSDKAQEASFRLISSTNRDPMEAIREGRLREDLYYRINTIEIRVPPLRERLEDIQYLADHFLQKLSEKYQRPACRISEESYQRLFEHTWPGNVRELQHAVERAILLCKSEVIDVDALPFAAARAMAATSAGSAAVTRTVPVPVAGQISAPSKDDGATPNDPSFDSIGRMIVDKVPDSKSGAEPVDVFSEIERVVVSAALARTRGNKQAAANLLGIYRPRLYSLIKRHNLNSD
ncbi:MAG TPA: sigma-54 dependent transcriptional regulator [Blastocatellia bacterium]|nr:sigma-54 dependent transcriptional regulator [Blastocatellia bacterium]